MKYRFIVCNMAINPKDISSNRQQSENTSVYDFEMPNSAHMPARGFYLNQMAIEIGRGKAFMDGWHAGNTVSKLFYLRLVNGGGIEWASI